MSAEEVVMNTRWTTLQSTYKLTLSRLGGGGGESARADFKCRYLNNGYSYDSNISRLFQEIHCQYGQKKW